MSPDVSFDDLMARLRAGDEDAAAQVFHRFAQRLIGLARSRLDRRLRPKMDPEDVLQSVYRSFFRRHAGGQLQVSGWDSLWSLLTVITVRKCGRWLKRFHTDRRDISAEVPSPAGGAAAAGWEGLAREPTPLEAAMLAETVADLLRGRDEREREIVTLTLQGADMAEIAAQVGRTRRTVQRVLKRVKEELQGQPGADRNPCGGPGDGAGLGHD